MNKNICNAGVLLIELLITIAILGFALCPLIVSFNRAISIFMRIDEISIANQIAQREMELRKINFKYTSGYSPVSSSDNKILDVVTGDKIPEYSAWKYDITIENNDITPNSQTLHGRLKKLSLTVISPRKNEYNYVIYLTTGGNNN